MAVLGDAVVDTAGTVAVPAPTPVEVAITLWVKLGMVVITEPVSLGCLSWVGLQAVRLIAELCDGGRAEHCVEGCIVVATLGS